MEHIIIKTNKLCKTFSTDGNQQHVLRNLDLEIGADDFTVIMGSSGSGKSTLLYALSGMDTPSLGDVLYEEKSIVKLSQDELAVFRRKNCGFIFQQINLMDYMSVMDNILACGLLITNDRGSVRERAEKLLNQVGIGETLWNKFPSQISGGEAQRVGIVRALINAPRTVFADEPTGALNHASSIQVLDVLSEVNRQGQSIVMVTHDKNSALRGSRIIYLRDGVICGECRLGTFDKNNQERTEKLNVFLKEMGW